jgi:hypothetical protein
MLSEVASGYQVSRSSNEGQLADTQTRSFRVMLNSPAEGFDIQGYCGVYIGDPHPVNTNVFCTSFDTRFDGDSRMVLICTFQYASQASQSNSQNQQDPKQSAPDVRPANWTTSTSLIEVPVYTWSLLNPATGEPVGVPVVPQNAAGDRFDAISRYEMMVTISVQHWEADDPTNNIFFVGDVNDRPFVIGSLNCSPHTLMLRGISNQPAVESWGGLTYRGWNSTYEFCYRSNFVRGLWNGFGNPLVDASIGWDIAVPQTGFNCLAFAPGGALPEQDIFGQPLKHEDGKIVDPEQLPDGIAVGERVRAMVKVFEYESGGASQLPSAQPIALTETGQARKSFGPGAADPPVIIQRYSIYKEIDFANTFALRGLGG